MHKGDEKINYKNNKVRVSAFGVIVTFILLILGCIAFTLPWWDGPPNESLTLGIFIITSIPLILLPLGLFLYAFIRMWPIVVIDEKGLHRSLLGKFFKKNLLWEEIVCIRNIRTLGSAVMWTFFSKSDITGMGVGRCRLRRDNVYLMYSDKLQSLVTRYYGKAIETDNKAK